MVKEMKNDAGFEFGSWGFEGEGNQRWQGQFPGKKTRPQPLETKVMSGNFSGE